MADEKVKTEFSGLDIKIQGVGYINSKYEEGKLVFTRESSRCKLKVVYRRERLALLRNVVSFVITGNIQKIVRKTQKTILIELINPSHTKIIVKTKTEDHKNTILDFIDLTLKDLGHSSTRTPKSKDVSEVLDIIRFSAEKKKEPLEFQNSSFTSHGNHKSSPIRLPDDFDPLDSSKKAEQRFGIIDVDASDGCDLLEGKKYTSLKRKSDHFNQDKENDMVLGFLEDENANVDKENCDDFDWQRDVFDHIPAARRSDNDNSRVKEPNKFLQNASIKAARFYNRDSSTKDSSEKRSLPEIKKKKLGYGSEMNSGKRAPGILPDPTSTTKKPSFESSLSKYFSDRTKKLYSSSQSTNTSNLQGFINLGNTCYMNSILQSLYCLDTFVSDLKHNSSHFPEDTLLRKLLRLWQLKRGTEKSDLKQCLRAVKSAISKSAIRFSDTLQHDAHELLNQLLDQLKEEVIALNKTDTVCASLEELKSPTEKFCNPTTLNFEFEVTDTYQCPNCKNQFDTVENHIGISVDCPRQRDGNMSSIQDALKAYMKKEIREYACEKCQHKQSEVVHKFTRLPRILIIHVKRYSCRGTAVTKIGRPIEIPKFITLCPFSSQKIEEPYDVHSMLSAFDYASPRKNRNFGDETDGGSKFTGRFQRKLDYGRSLTSTPFKFSDKSDIETAIELSKKTAEEDKEKAEKENEDLARALEVSKLEVSGVEQNTSIVIPTLGNEDDDFQKAIELSTTEAQKDEDNELRLATEMSLKDIGNGSEIVPFEEEENDDVSSLDETDGNKEMIEELLKNNCKDGDMPLSYRLVSIVTHKGESTGSGHYISDVYNIKKKKWFSFNDEQITLMTEEKVRSDRQKDGYIFFYMNLNTLKKVEDNISCVLRERENQTSLRRS